MKTADDGMNLYCSICGKSIRFHSKIKCENQTWVKEFVPKEVEEEALVEDTEPELEAKVEEAGEEVVEEEESLDDEDLEAYFKELPVKELKKLCKEADLSTKGKKADLVARLLE